MRGGGEGRGWVVREVLRVRVRDAARSLLCLYYTQVNDCSVLRGLIGMVACI